MGIPKGKEKSRLYEPIVVYGTPFTGVMKQLVEKKKKMFEEKKINKIDFEELRKQAKEIEGNKSIHNIKK